ncbi:MAG: Gfo/Idh/MocA family oxidoreductase [Kiritimatiellaeota bacterium]|nr:Gfo/Idh/MocA family oxidoreductase [Kiritimatiellota bacterium]
MAEKIRVGVVGVGALGRHHARLYGMNDAAEVVGIYDANPAVAKSVADEFGYEIHDTIERLAANCEALSIAVPSHLHHQVAIPLLKSGKHLLIEKPIATKLEDASEMVRLASENNLVLGVGHVERFNPVMGYLESMSDRARFLEVQRLAPYPPGREGMLPRGTEVSVILDLMIHDLEIILHIVGSEVEKIDANGLPAFSDTEDICNARIQFKNGCVANVSASRIALTGVRQYRVFYTDAYLFLDYGKGAGILHTKDKENLRVVRTKIPINDHNALEKELENFISCVISSKSSEVASVPKVSGQKGMEALKLALDIEKTIEEYNRKHKFEFE